MICALVCAAPLALAGCHARRAPAPAGTAGPEVLSPAEVPSLPVRDPRADIALAAGGDRLRDGRAAAAVREFHRCLVLEPGRAECLDGKGRAHAALREWEDAVLAWEELAAARPDDAELAKRLAAARRSWKAFLEKRARAATHVVIGVRSAPEGAPVNLRLAARFQRYNSAPAVPADVYDPDIDSPKSVRISADGKKAYVNSLEGAATVIYGLPGLEKRGLIRHSFGRAQSWLFSSTVPWFGASFSEDIPPGGPNIFKGKPVESEFSHDGRFLWVPYYRRNFDLDGTQPSAAAVVDARSDTIVRVVPAGPIAKNAAASPDGRFMALAHWGDNSVGFIDISSPEPAGFFPAGVVAVGPREPPAGSEAVNRDLECGLCMRGLAWTSDGRYLFAGCMGGSGGVAVIDSRAAGGPALLGRVSLGGKPRDLLVSPDGRWLYVSASNAGAVIRAETELVVKAALQTGNMVDLSTAAAHVGGLPRSMKLSPDGRWLFVALNADSQVAVVDVSSLEVVSRVTVDSFPVGLDISPDGRSLWVTSQGNDGAGGNSVEIFEVSAAAAAQPLPGGPEKIRHTAPPPLP